MSKVGISGEVSVKVNLSSGASPPRRSILSMRDVSFVVQFSVENFTELKNKYRNNYDTNTAIDVYTMYLKFLSNRYGPLPCGVAETARDKDRLMIPESSTGTKSSLSSSSVIG